jgi:hypothetical protein
MDTLGAYQRVTRLMSACATLPPCVRAADGAATESRTVVDAPRTLVTDERASTRPGHPYWPVLNLVVRAASEPYQHPGDRNPFADQARKRHFLQASGH